MFPSEESSFSFSPEWEFLSVSCFFLRLHFREGVSCLKLLFHLEFREYIFFGSHPIVFWGRISDLSASRKKLDSHVCRIR